MNTDKRSIVRKRTQQLVYVELGRDNGGVMLNLSEDGCGFQAISPVKAGETRFAFQISGGRRIAGEAETVWVDDIGIMGGLRFLNMDPQPRQEIRKWLEETNAPDELGEGVLSAAPRDGIAQGSRFRAKATAQEDSASIPRREYRQHPWPPTTVDSGTDSAASTSWGGTFTGTSALMDDDRLPPQLPLLREDGAFVSSHRKSLAFWRGIAAIATAAALGALLVVYQHDVGSYLIWLGEMLSGKAKASAVGPASKSESPEQPATRPMEVSSPADKADVSTIPSKDPDATRSSEPEPAKESSGTASGIGAPSESVLERQVARDKSEPFSGTETVESLWAAVQSGSVSAELSLADRFARGNGVAQNCDQAKVLLRAASRRGSREASLKLYQLESEGCH